MTLADIGLLVGFLTLVVTIAIRYESMRKDSLKNKHDIGGIGRIAKDAKEEVRELELMLFYLALVSCEGDAEKREKVLASMFEAATRKGK
jgi:hypothetical protein